jgi:hypothetical protein
VEGVVEEAQPVRDYLKTGPGPVISGVLSCSVENLDVVAEFVRIRLARPPNSHEFGYEVSCPLRFSTEQVLSRFGDDFQEIILLCGNHGERGTLVPG